MSPIPVPIEEYRTVHRLLAWSWRLNWCVERLCALLLGTMVLIVWLGILTRYFLNTNVTWTEELARYLMIWAALLAVSCCARHREHIGFDLLFSRLPARLCIRTGQLLDLIAIGFFSYLAYYGASMTVAGAHQYATIFGMNMMLPFAAVPVSAVLTIVQILASSLRCPISNNSLVKLEMATTRAGGAQ